MAADDLLRPAPDGVLLRLRLTPKARRSGVTGLARDADGRMHVTAAVTALPADGAANAALIALLAKTWHRPKSAIRVVSGHASRMKMIHVSGDPAELVDSLNAWTQTLAGAADRGE